MIAADASLDRQAVWEQIDRRRRGGVEAPAIRLEAGAMGCLTCGLVSAPPVPGPCTCPRCGARLHAREHDSIGRCWALTLSAMILYVPANYYPVLTVVQLGAGSPSTILGGVRELLASGLYPLAALVFFASVAVPVLKLFGLMLLLVTTQMGRKGRLRDRAVLYRIVSAVGRWSMIDIFMVSILVADIADLAHPHRHPGGRRLAGLGHALAERPGDRGLARCRRRACGRPVPPPAPGHRPWDSQQDRPEKRRWRRPRDSADDA